MPENIFNIIISRQICLSINGYASIKTEKGFYEALYFSKIPASRKNFLPTKYYEVQKVVKKLIGSQRPENYNPIDKEKKE